MRFVKISGTIYDYSQYKLNISTLQNAILKEIENSMSKFGFIKQRENLFYNKKFDLLLKLEIKNKSKLKFV
jgi:hypothetical protein